ncbi:hypothetical protein [Prolixibacter sp. SD074]|uniref:hypothetical protein n=1 Tax=Prolixibacter sp. SD074 TaxID=2652391 RepID=UPI0012991329|nr:hypothetical protein [Prolixibacter sp. SD074]
MKIIRFSLLALLLAGSKMVMAQSAKQEDFRPHGKALVQVFSNFTYRLSDSKGKPSFDISRAYLGYEYAFSHRFSGKVIFDAGRPDTSGIKLSAVLKNAYLQYNGDKLRLNFGVIPTSQFMLQDKFWGHRYVAPTFMDAYHFGPEADLGASLAWKFSPYVQLDVSVLNGEGYQKLQQDSALQYTTGLTIQPVKNLYARFYFDHIKKGMSQNTYSAFLGYAGSKVTAGLEYNYQLSHANVNDQDRSGISLYATMKLKRHSNLFIRYDKLWSKRNDGALDGWDVLNDGRLYLAGIDFHPVKGVTISPNMSGWYPVHDTHHIVSRFNLSLQFKF